MLLQTVFHIDETHKDYVMKRASKIHRNFRSTLTKCYMIDEDGDIIETPPDPQLGTISQADWNEFVQTRLSEAFKARSEKNSQSAKSCQYPYLGGRKTFPELEYDMVCS